jgi:tetratricopeptide (TPR) repeat protein
MARQTPTTRDLARIADGLDDAVEAILGLMLVVTPLAFGSMQAWSQEIFVGLIAAALLCVCTKWILAGSTGQTLRLWVLLPVALFLLLVLAQLLPLPASLLHLIAPGTLQLKTSLLHDLPNAQTKLQHLPLTFYPWATWQQLRLLLAVIALFLVVLDVYRDPLRIRRLLSVIALVGLAVAGLAMYENLSGTRLIYGLVPMVHRNAGPFMNYSHFSQFMNLSIGAGAGLLLVRLMELFGHHPTTGEVVTELQQPRNWMLWMLALLCVIGPVTICLSMSRMGAISLLVSAGVSGAVLAWRGRSASPGGEHRDSLHPRHRSRHRYPGGLADGSGSVLLILGILALALLLCVGFDSVYDRLATVQQFQAKSTGGIRLQMLRDMTAEFRRFPLLGTGLGTHEFVYPMFNHLNVPFIATHAEDEYAQMLEECGAAGLLIILSFIGIVFVSYLRVIGQRTDTIDYAAFGLGFGLLAILIHSASDFGQHVPADAALTAICSALLINLSRNLPSRARSARLPQGQAPIGLGPTFSPGWLAAVGRFCFAIALVCAAGWALTTADRARRAESVWATTSVAENDLAQANWHGTDQQFINLLRPATQAAAIDPGNVFYQYRLNIFRWESISRNVDQLGRCLLDPTALAFADRIAAELEAARWLCPTYGPPLCIAGQINLFAFSRQSGADEIRTSYRLTPCDPTVCLVAGMLAVWQHQYNQSLEPLQRNIMLGGSSRSVISIYVRSGRPDLAYTVAQKNLSDLQYLAALLQQDPAQAALASKCAAESDALLADAVERPDASADEIAQLAARAALQGNTTQAIRLYRRALDMNFGQVLWRIQLAKMLGDSEQFAAAQRELRVCLRLHPQLAQAQTMLADYSTRTDARLAAGAPVVTARQ